MTCVLCQLHREQSVSFLKVYIFPAARLINAECFSLCPYSFFITLYIAVINTAYILARICDYTVDACAVKVCNAMQNWWIAWLIEVNLNWGQFYFPPCHLIHKNYINQLWRNCLQNFCCPNSSIRWDMAFPSLDFSTHPHSFHPPYSKYLPIMLLLWQLGHVLRIVFALSWKFRYRG
jgi:hypothetical protein